MAVIAGTAAMAIDLGSYMAKRRDLQNAADAIALAAAQDLPSESAVMASSNDWQAKNEMDDATMSVQVTQQNAPSVPNPSVKVTLTESHSFTFGRIIGITSKNVSASATAIKTSPAGGDGVVPLSVTDEALNSVPWGSEVVLKYDSNDILTGNTGPIRIDGAGSGNCSTSDAYCDGVEFGANNVVCALNYDDTYCSGPSVVDTEPGNKVGATREAINYRINNTDSHCDTFAEVFQDDPRTSDPDAYTFNSSCNPFIEGSYESRRVVIIPVIDQLCNGSCDVTILDFALFFIERMGTSCGNGNGNGGDSALVRATMLSDHNPAFGGPRWALGPVAENPHGTPPGQQTTPTNTPVATSTPAPTPTPCSGGSACTGNDCEVIGRFVQIGQNVGLLAGTYNPNASNNFIRLVR